MIIARIAEGLDDAAVLHGRFERRARLQLSDRVALEFLPRRVGRRVGIAATRLQGLAACLDFLFRHEPVHRRCVEVDPQSVAGLYQGDIAARRRFRGGVQDRGRSERRRRGQVEQPDPQLAEGEPELQARAASRLGVALHAVRRASRRSPDQLPDDRSGRRS